MVARKLSQISDPNNYKETYVIYIFNYMIQFMNEFHVSYPIWSVKVFFSHNVFKFVAK